MPLTLKDASGADVQVPTAEEIAEMITGAVRSHTDKANKKLSESILKEVGETVKGSLGELEAKIKPAATVPSGEPSGKDDPAMADMRKRLEEAEKVISAERDARVKAETSRRNDSTRNAISSLLGPSIRPEAVKLVTDHLFQHSIDFDEDGNTPLFKLKKAAALGMPEEEIRLPLDAGIREFLKSKDNEWLIPTRAPAAQKPGARMPQGPLANQVPRYDQPATSEDEKIRRAMEREQVLKAQGIGG